MGRLASENIARDGQDPSDGSRESRRRRFRGGGDRVFGARRRDRHTVQPRDNNGLRRGAPQRHVCGQREHADRRECAGDQDASALSGGPQRDLRCRGAQAQYAIQRHSCRADAQLRRRSSPRSCHSNW